MATKQTELHTEPCTRCQPVDSECLLLAAHFLQDVDGATQADIDDLAQELQDVCETYCHALEVDDYAAG